MNGPRLPDPIDVSAVHASAVPSKAPRRSIADDRDWYASSRELAEGLVVRELDEAIVREVLSLR